MVHESLYQRGDVRHPDEVPAEINAFHSRKLQIRIYLDNSTGNGQSLGDAIREASDWGKFETLRIE